MRRVLLLMLLVCVATFAKGQSNEVALPKAVVTGQVIDTTTNKPIIGAVVLVKDTDNGSITDVNGRFSIGNIVQGQQSELEVTFVGYNTVYLKVTPNANPFAISKPIYMDLDPLEILDVQIMGSAPTAEIKGDTITFNAGAYKTNPDATASDLLEKMPGFEKNDDGSVSSMGEKVQRVMVDGKTFFKDDAATALNALDADMIESVELYDDTSDRSKFTGFSDGTEIKTINIVTKNRLGGKPAYMLESTLGAGFEDIYQAGINYTHIEGDRQISAMGGINNININPVQQRRGFGRGQAGGINTQTGAAINYTTAIKNDGEFAVSYNFQRKDNEIERSSLRTYFPSPEYQDYTYTTLDTTNNISNSHRFALDIKANLGETTQITFRPTASYSYSDNLANNYDVSMRDGNNTINDSEDSSSSDSYALSGDLNILQKLGATNYFGVKFGGNINNSTSNTYIIGNSYYDMLGALDTIAQNQNSDILNTNNTVNAGVEFAQRLGEKSNISINYDYEYNWSDNDRKTFLIDEVTGDIMDDVDTTLSNHFLRDYHTNTVSTRYNFTGENSKLMLSVGYRNALLENQELFPDDSYNRNYSFNGMTVSGMYTYQPNKQGASLRIGYRGTPNYPSVTQLQDVMNNDNPLQLSSGNPDLEQSYQHSLNFRYHGANMQKSTFWGMFGRMSATTNAVVNNTIIIDRDTTLTVGGQDYLARAGSQYTSPINHGTNISVMLGGMFSFPLEVIKSKMNVMLMYRNSIQPSVYNNEDYLSTSNSFTLRLGLNSNISQNIDFNINNSSTYELSKSNMVSDNKYFTNNLRTNIYWSIYNNFFTTFEYTMRYQHLENTELDEPITNLLNFSIGKKFGPEGRYEVRASIYDILNQNKNISQQVSDIYIAETLSNNLTRYVALTFTYKFSSIRRDANQRYPGMGGQGGRGGYGGGRGGYGGGRGF